MYKFVWKFFFFLLFSVVLYFISYTSFTKSILPNPSFYYLSTLVDKFDKKIQNITISSLKPKLANGSVNYSIIDSSGADNTDVGVKKTHDSTDDLNKWVKQPLNHQIYRHGESIKNSNYGRYEVVTEKGYEDGSNYSQSAVVNTYFIYLLRIFSRFLFLIFVQFYVFYILLFRYGELFKDLCDLSIKSLKDFNWRSPINFMKSFFYFVTWLLSIFLYYNSQLSLRNRLILYSFVVLLVSLLLFRAGIGTRGLINTSSLFIGLTVYLSALLAFNSKIPGSLVFVDNWFVYIWSLAIFLRGFKLDSVDNVRCLTVRGSRHGPGVDSRDLGGSHSANGSTSSEMDNVSIDYTSGGTVNSTQLGYSNSLTGYSMVKLSHEASCALDLHLILLILNLIKSVPFLGKLFEMNAYTSNVSLMFNISMLIHCFIVYASPVSSLCRSSDRVRNRSLANLSVLDSTPLSKIRQLVLYVLNYVFFYIFGVPDYFSTKSTSLNQFLHHFNKLKQLFKVVFGKFLDPLCNRPSFLFIIKCVESIPQMLFLLLPPFFSRVYFEYSTLFMPITTFLSHNNSFEERAFCLIVFSLSNLVRNVCNLMHRFSFRSFLRILLIFTLNYLMVLSKKFIKLTE